MVNGKPALRVKAGKTEDYILPEELVEAICGVPVAAIVFQEQAQPQSDGAQAPTKAHSRTPFTATLPTVKKIIGGKHHDRHPDDQNQRRDPA